MEIRDLILDCLIEDDEAFTQIEEFLTLSQVDISKDKLEKLLSKMEKEGYVYINYDWENEHNEYPYSLTEKGINAWKEIKW